MMFLNIWVNTWSVHDRPRWKPACSSQRRWSAAPLSWQSSMVKKAFPVTESRVIPRLFVHSIMLPSFGSLRMTPFCQFSGTASIHQHSLNSFVSTFVTISPPYFSNSDWISSMPAGLFDFWAFIAKQTSCWDMAPSSTWRAPSASCCSKLYVLVQCFPEVFDSTSILLFFGHQKFVILYSVICSTKYIDVWSPSMKPFVDSSNLFSAVIYSKYHRICHIFIKRNHVL